MPERINLENPDFDVLGDVLKTLRFHGTIFFRSDLAAPWGISLKQIGIPRFHIILAGECYVGAQGVAPVKARKMDIIMIPNGHSHWIADQPNRKLVSSERAGEACELGQPLFQDNEITNELMCGIVHLIGKQRIPFSIHCHIFCISRVSKQTNPSG